MKSNLSNLSNLGYFSLISKEPDVRTQVPGRKYGQECPCVDKVDGRYIGAEHSFKSVELLKG